MTWNSKIKSSVIITDKLDIKYIEIERLVQIINVTISRSYDSSITVN